MHTDSCQQYFGPLSSSHKANTGVCDILALYKLDYYDINASLYCYFTCSRVFYTNNCEMLSITTFYSWNLSKANKGE